VALVLENRVASLCRIVNADGRDTESTAVTTQVTGPGRWVAGRLRRIRNDALCILPQIQIHNRKPALGILKDKREGRLGTCENIATVTHVDVH
jgi:hypothetical protein